MMLGGGCTSAPPREAQPPAGQLQGQPDAAGPPLDRRAFEEREDRDAILKLYALAGFPSVTGLQLQQRSVSVGGGTLCTIGFTMLQEDHQVFLDIDLGTSHGEHPIHNVPLAYRNMAANHPGIRVARGHRRRTVRDHAGPTGGSMRPLPATVLLQGGLEDPESDSCLQSPRSTHLRSLTLAVWAQQQGLPARPLRPGSVQDYRTALCRTLKDEISTGLGQWQSRSELERLLHRAEATCTASDRIQVQAQLAGLHPHGVLESELADWAPYFTPERFRNVHWRVSDPRPRILAQGDLRIPELLELADSPVIGRSHMTVGELARQLLNDHALRALEDSAAARAWWDEAKSQTADERLQHALWHPDALIDRVASRLVARYGWGVVDRRWPLGFGPSLASHLLSSTTPGTRGQRRHLTRRLFRGKPVPAAVFELDQQLALNLLARRHDPEEEIRFARVIIEARHPAGLRQLASQISDPTISFDSWVTRSLCDVPDCPQQLRAALLARLRHDLASVPADGWDRGELFSTLGKLLGVPADVFKNDHPVIDRRNQVDAALRRAGLDPLQTPLRRTPIGERNALAGFRATGPPSPALKSAAAWLGERLGRPIENPYLFMWEFWAAMATEHEVAWQLRIARSRKEGLIVDVSDQPEEAHGIALRDGKSFAHRPEPWTKPLSIHQLTDSFGLDWSAPQAEPWIELTFVFSLPLRARITRTPSDG